MLKRMRIDPDTSAVPNQGIESIKGKARGVTIEDVEEEEDEDDAEVSGDFAPGGDADYFVEEDEEGRFFGGGLTAEQKKILNIFDEAPNQDGQDVSRYAKFSFGSH